MKPILIVVIAVVAVIITVIVGKNIVSHFHKEYGMTGDAATSLEAKNKDIEKLHKDIEKRKEAAYYEERRQSQYEQLDQSSTDARMDVGDFREAPDENTLRSATGLPSAASKWQTWLYLAFIALGGWMILSRLRSRK